MTNDLNERQSDSNQDRNRSQTLYVEIVHLHETEGLGRDEIAERLNCCSKTVTRYMNLWRNRVPVNEVRSRGRPRLLESSDLASIRQTVATAQASGSSTTRTQVVDEIRCRRGVAVSKWTVGRAMKDGGFVYGKPMTVPLLTERHKATRMQWAASQNGKDWSKTFFSDETTIQLGANLGCEWYKKGKRRIVGKVKYPAKAMFWAAVSLDFKSPLIVVDGHVDSKKYVKIIKEEFLPWMKKLKKGAFVFQQDNAPCHTSKFTREFFEQKKVELLPWPPNSPDLNPIENLWAVLKQRVSSRNPRNKSELIQFAKEEWLGIPQAMVRKTIESMPRRLSQVIEREGAKCDY